MKETIEKHEKLYRMVIMNPNYWKNELGKPSSAVFKDSKGVSVDRDGSRSELNITETFIERFGAEKMKAIVSITAEFCYDLETHLVYSPTDDNKYHAEIHASEERAPLSNSKARKLANECIITWENNY